MTHRGSPTRRLYIFAQRYQSYDTDAERPA